MNRALRFAFASVLLAGLVLIGQAAAAKPLRVVTTFTILADMVRQVGGNRVDVVTLVGPDGDAHTFEPTPQDAKAVAQADVFVVNGLGFEGWMDRLVKAAAFKGRIVVASTGIKPRELDENGRPESDPHAWQDVANGQRYVANIVSGLSAASAADTAFFKTNGDRYRAELTELDHWVRSKIEIVPPSRRKIITSHDAFGYFGAAYGVEFLAAEGVSTESEASAMDVAKLVRQARKTGISAIFLENMSDPRLAEQLARETGITLGGTLYADALSAPNGPAPTYAVMFRHNATLISEAMLTNAGIPSR